MDDTNTVFPLDGLDPNMPALVNVEVGGKGYAVKLYRDRWQPFRQHLECGCPKGCQGHTVSSR